MSRSARDDFSVPTTKALADRAAHMCSRPDCAELTIGPGSEPMKAVRTGEAAHITAAAPGGPRFDTSLTAEQRADITNGIWLCRRCAALVDKDSARFTAGELRRWKAEHEAWVANGGAVGARPSIVVSSTDGFSFPTVGDVNVSAEENEKGREYQITVELTGRATIVELEVECQLPERVYRAWLHHPPVGVDVRFEPMVLDMISEGARTTYGATPPPMQWRLAVGALRPQQRLNLRFRSVVDEDTPSLGPFAHLLHGEQFWLRGHYRWEYRGAPVRRDLVVVIQYDRATRRMTSSEHTPESVKLTRTMSFP